MRSRTDAKKEARRNARKEARRELRLKRLKRPLIVRILTVALQVVLAAAVFALAAALIIDLVVTGTTRSRIMDAGDPRLAAMEDVDAVIVLGSLPVMVLYPFVQKYFVKGMMIGSVKG